MSTPATVWDLQDLIVAASRKQINRYDAKSSRCQKNTGVSSWWKSLSPPSFPSARRCTCPTPACASLSIIDLRINNAMT